MIINSIALNKMTRDASNPHTPHSTDKLKIRNYGSKSLSKCSPNSPSPVIIGKGGK